jgi:hypothetical protein
MPRRAIAALAGLAVICTVDAARPHAQQPAAAISSIGATSPSAAASRVPSRR